MNIPLISIIVPCYNQAQYLDECLQSVLDQTFQDWECFIINDGSPDNTEDIAKNWIQKDNRFIYLEKENGGVSSARNFGISNAKGEWILPLDGDDKISSSYLDDAQKNFKFGYDIIFSHAEYFGVRNGRMPLPAFDEKRLLIENQIFCSAFFKKVDWKMIGGFDEELLEGYEDWEFWIHLLAKKGSLKTLQLDITGLFYRIKSVSRNTDAIFLNDLLIRKKIYQKHLAFFLQNISTFLDIDQENKRLKKELAHLNQILFSARYRILNKIMKLLGK